MPPQSTDLSAKIKNACLAVSPMQARIREDECIGCTKCIQACPVDAIIGASKLMHTILTDHCIGCELCVAPCPVDCIDMIAVPEKTELEKKSLVDRSIKRYNHRLQHTENIKREQIITPTKKTPDEIRSDIQDILKRTKIK